jgi:hypothetical protein
MPWNWLALTGSSMDRPGGMPKLGGRSWGCVGTLPGTLPGKVLAKSSSAGSGGGSLGSVRQPAVPEGPLIKFFSAIVYMTTPGVVQ